MSQINVYHIEYDICEGSGIDNPSSHFRRLGFRSSLSVWVIPQDKMPMTYLHEFKRQLDEFNKTRGARNDLGTWRRGKCRWVRMQMDEADAQLWAQQAVAEEIERLVRQAAGNLERARRDYDREGSGMTPAQFEERVNKHLQKRIEELEEMLEGAGQFGVTPQMVPGDWDQAMPPAEWARIQVLAIEQRCKDQAKAYVAATRALAAAPSTDAQQIAAAAADDAVPVGVLADAARDFVADGGAAADALEGAFATAAPAATDDDWAFDRLPWEGGK